MSMLARRAVLRAMPRVRGVASDASAGNWKQQQEALRAHAAETANMWRRISYYVCLPAIGVTYLWVRNVEKEHEHHIEHLVEENGGKLPQPPPYEYLNRRASGPFPWGKNALFFNSRVNKDMNEDE
ncbi:cytochrome c oxidase, subunit VIa, partial [Obba rivulosa]